MKRKLIILAAVIPILFVALSFGRAQNKPAEMKERKAAVKAGEITKAEAMEKMIDLKSAWAEDALNTKQQKISKHIEDAVESGKMTREQADEKLAKIEKHIAAHKVKITAKGESGRIKAAVMAGDLTKKEARQKLKEIKATCSSACDKSKEASGKQ